MMKHQGEDQPCGEEITFEEAIHGLQEAVEQLEAGELTLDQALEAFERGVHLARCCSAYLDQAELRVRELAPEESFPDESEQGGPSKTPEIPS